MTKIINTCKLEFTKESKKLNVKKKTELINPIISIMNKLSKNVAINIKENNVKIVLKLCIFVAICRFGIWKIFL